MKVFKEEQRFTQVWLLVVLLVSILVPAGIILQEYLRENSQISTNQLLVSLALLIASVGIIFIFKLTTRIDENGIHYQFFPFHLKFRKIGWEEIEKAFVRNYNPIGEYGGWGLKGGFIWSKNKGKCINVSGDIGIQLILKNGNKLLIGTQQKEAAISILKTYQNKENEN